MEVASLLYEEALKMSSIYGNLHVQFIHGGTNIRHNISSLRSRCPDLLVGTPGRMLELLTQYAPQVQHLLHFSNALSTVLDTSHNNEVMFEKERQGKTLAIVVGADQALQVPLIRCA
jgi:hypothetical protein